MSGTDAPLAAQKSYAIQYPETDQTRALGKASESEYEWEKLVIDGSVELPQPDFVAKNKQKYQSEYPPFVARIASP